MDANCQLSNDNNYALVDPFQGCHSLNIDGFSEVCENFRPNEFSVLNLNIRGCRTNFNDFLSTLETLDVSFSCIALTETNITNNTDVNFVIKGYKCENLYTGHGIKLYIKDSLSYKCIDTLIICNEVIECIFVKINFKYSKDITLGAVYRPHSSSIRTFNEYLNDNILSKLRRNQTTLIGGDFNINLRNLGKDMPINEFVDTMQSFNLFQYVTEITRYNDFNSTNSSIIDHIWTNFNCAFSTYVLECGISDHYPVIFQTEFINTSNISYIKFRDYSSHNFEKFFTEFPERWHTSNLSLTNAQDSMQQFIDWFNDSLNLYFPLKTKQVGNKKLKNPWMNDTMLICIKKKHRFYKLMRQGKLSESFYNKYRNLVTFAIRALKKRYYNNAFISLKNDMKGTWALLNELLDRKQKDIIKELVVNEAPTSDPVEITNTLNNYFCSIPSELRNSLPPASNSNIFNNFPSTRNSFFLAPTCASDISAVMNSFNN